jgi:hypothetical protein
LQGRNKKPSRHKRGGMARGLAEEEKTPEVKDGKRTIAKE